MKRLFMTVYNLLFISIAFSQSSENCYTQANKKFLKTELQSLTEIYKSVLSDCNSANPTNSKNDCEADLTNIKNNIEQLTALNTLVETLGCNYTIYKDDKPCTSGKYCQAYKIEDKSTGASTAKSAEEIKAEYDIERKKIRTQNRQQFFELVFKIIGLLFEDSNNAGILGEIKKLINGEENANERYTILNENQSYIETDGERQGFKLTHKNGYTTYALDTDEDGKVDRAITYNKNGLAVAEHPMAKKRKNGKAATGKVLNASFNFYSDCITTLNVKGFKGVCHDWEQPDHEFLYIIGASVKDCGESDWNWISPSADIGLVVRANNNTGKILLHNEKNGRLFGPYNEGGDKNDPNKYEWLDYCSMRYNNFAIADLRENPVEKIYLFAQEGDDQERFQGHDDDIFVATVSVEDIRRGNIAVTGKCDITGRCATLYFAIGTYKDNQGKFWNNNLPSNVPSLTGTVATSIVKGVATAPLHPVRTAKDIKKVVDFAGEGIKWTSEEAAFFTNKYVLKNIYDGAGYIWNGAKKIVGVFDKKWVVIKYGDGTCIFNHVRGYRTMEEIVNTATGDGPGDCDWWYWPEGGAHACLDSKKNAQKMIKKHGKIKDIKWIDHPTKNCGK